MRFCLKAKLHEEKTDASDAAKMLHLIKAAEQIFLTQGYHTATMNDVAKAAGMSKKTVYQLIDSKTELFAELVHYRHESFTIPKPQQDWTVNEMLVQNLLSLGTFMLAPPQIAMTRLIMAEHTHSNDFGRLFHQKGVSKVKTLLENCLHQTIPADRLKGGDLRELSAILFGMALGELHFKVLIGFRQAPGKAALTRRIQLAVDLFLAGQDRLSLTNS